MFYDLGLPQNGCSCGASWTIVQHDGPNHLGLCALPLLSQDRSSRPSRSSMVDGRWSRGSSGRRRVARPVAAFGLRVDFDHVKIHK